MTRRVSSDGAGGRDAALLLPAGERYFARRLALAAGASLLFTVSLRGWGYGLAAVPASALLAFALDGVRRPVTAAALAWVAWLGLALPVFGSASLVIWWSTPALLLLYGLAWALVGAGCATLGRLTPLALPLIVTAAEFLVGNRSLLGDHAFSILAYTQADTPLRYLAAWSGTSATVLATALLGSAAVWVARGRWSNAALGVGLVAALTALSAAGVAGERQLGSLRIGVVQTAQSTAARLLAPFSEALAAEHAAPFAALTHEAVRAGAELVVWGETTLPDVGREELPRPYRTALDAAPVAVAGGLEYAEDGLYNAVYASRGGGLEVIARKQALVPIVEAPYSNGRSSDPTSLQGAYVAAFVCLDSLHGGLSRESVRRGTELLLYLTDDSFAGLTAATWFHLRTAVFRAVETGRSAVFANEAGPSALIGPHGDILLVAEQHEAVAAVGEVPLMRGTTLFSALGDWIGAASGVAVLALLVAGLARRTCVRGAHRWP